MKSTASTLLAAFALLAMHTGCERHPASETIPGYAAKMKKKQAEAGETATHSEPADAQAPAYFPAKN